MNLKNEDKIKFQEIMKNRKMNSFIPDPEYYRNLPVKPGPDFFIKISNYSLFLNNYKIRIPDILVNQENRIKWLYTSKHNSDKNGFLDIRQNHKMYDFWNKMQFKCKRSGLNLDFEPAAVLQTSQDYNPSIIDIDTFKFKDAQLKYFSGPNNNQIIRRYIKSQGESFQIFRLVHYLRSKSSYGILIVSNIKYENQYYDLNHRYTLRDNQGSSCEISFIVGKSVDEYISYGSRIAELLSKVLLKSLLDIDY